MKLVDLFEVLTLSRDNFRICFKNINGWFFIYRRIIKDRDGEMITIIKPSYRGLIGGFFVLQALPSDAVWLQPENGVKWFCFQHSAQFESEVGWLAHLAECACLLWTPFLCTFVEGDQMCKAVLKSAADLIYHVEHAHGKFLCDRCGSKHDNIVDLRNHNHSHLP